MNKILVVIFAILLVPALGLPVNFDRWIYGFLILVVTYCVYKILVQIRSKEVVQNPTKISKPKKSNTKKEKTTKQQIEKNKQTTPLISDKEKQEIKKAVKESKKE